MADLSELQKKILGSLYYPESFDTILEEVNAPANYIADDIKTMIDRGMIKVVEPDDKGGYERRFYYDSDNMRAFYYQITKDGLDAYHAD